MVKADGGKSLHLTRGGKLDWRQGPGLLSWTGRATRGAATKEAQTGPRPVSSLQDAPGPMTSDRRQSRSVGYALRKIKNLERIPSFESAVTYIDLSTSLVKNYQG